MVLLLRVLRPHPFIPLPMRKAVYNGTVYWFRNDDGDRGIMLVDGGPLSVDLLESGGVTALILLMSGSNIRPAFDAQHFNDLSSNHEQSHVLLPETIYDERTRYARPIGSQHVQCIHNAVRSQEHLKSIVK
jgi:hypothetical protein